jgi:hypothetical protein
LLIKLSLVFLVYNVYRSVYAAFPSPAGAS